jgi:hypothetical protein
MSSSLNSFGRRVGALLAVAAATTAMFASSASAVTVGRHTVNDWAPVHSPTPASTIIGVLAPGDGFYYNGNSISGIWCNGDAYGVIQRGNVWVLCQYLV